MVEGQRLKILPENILMNISSFMLGTPQHFKIKQSNTFKQIQKKLKFDEIDLTPTVSLKQGNYFIDDEDTEETYKIEDYGYIIRDKNYSIKKALQIMKGQCDRLLDMARPYGSTHLWISFNYYDEDDEDDFLRLRIGDLDYLDTEDVLDKMDKWIMKWSSTLNGRIRFKSIQFFFQEQRHLL